MLENLSKDMEHGSFQEFIFEHYYGFTRLSERTSQEYRIRHPRWKINKVTKYHVNCNFLEMYGPDFAELTYQKPDAVFLAEGSNVSIDWKRSKIQ